MKRNRYSAAIVAALLACSPIVANNMMHTDINHIVQATVVNNGDTPETAYAITSKYDENMHTKIKWNKDLTNSDIDDYFDKHAHIYVNGNIKGKYMGDDDDFDSQEELKEKQNELGILMTMTLMFILLVMKKTKIYLFQTIQQCF